MRRLAEAIDERAYQQRVCHRAYQPHRDIRRVEVWHH